jgi:HEAT repeat protein
MHDLLDRIRQAKADPNSNSMDYYFGGMHTLAEEQDLLALDFFVECLDDSRWDWRHDCLSCLGFHYDLPEYIVEKVRRILLTDHNAMVRSTAASVLGTQSVWGDEALVIALTSDKDDDVRRAAFEALLTLAGFSPIMKRQIAQQFSNDKVPSLNALQTLLAIAKLDKSI